MKFIEALRDLLLGKSEKFRNETRDPDEVVPESNQKEENSFESEQIFRLKDEARYWKEVAKARADEVIVWMKSASRMEMVIKEQESRLEFTKTEIAHLKEVIEELRAEVEIQKAIRIRNYGVGQQRQEGGE